MNINPEFLKNNPLPSVKDLEFTTNDLKSAETETIQDIDNVYFWGKLINKRSKHNNHCVTSNNNKDGIFLKSCFENEPLQNFEYSADFTIRLFGTNKCLSVNETDSSLGKCMGTVHFSEETCKQDNLLNFILENAYNTIY